MGPKSLWHAVTSYLKYSVKTLNNLHLRESHKMMKERTICPCVHLSGGT